jgi:glycosyltransferase involved in cell wall biosynthesis
MNTLRLAIVTTHPIQYYAPIFQALERSGALSPRIFYTWSQTAAAGVVDPGFGRVVTWDVPLLEGYGFEFVPNFAERPGTEHFLGLRNPDLVPAIEKWRADAVLVFGWNSHSHLAAMRHFKGRIPVFFRGDSTLLDRGPRWRTLARRIFLTWVYRHIDVAIAVGSNNRDYYRWCGVANDRIAFAPHAIDTGRFADPDGVHERRAGEWRRQLGIPPEARVVLFAGKLQPKKDPLLLLDAFTRCGAPGHLVFAGNGVLEDELRARCQGRPDVHLLPFQNQQAMPAVYRLGDVFVLPSRGPGETWGLAINEAMASGRAVIASTQAGGTRDLLTDGRSGWAFKPGDSVQLQGILRRALTCESEVLRTMGAKAREVASHWSIAETVSGFESAVMTFARRPPAA